MLDSILNKMCVLQDATEPMREGKGTQIQPVAPERAVEDPEAKAEDMKAVLQAMGSGGLEGVKRMLANMDTTPRGHLGGF